MAQKLENTYKGGNIINTLDTVGTITKNALTAADVLLAPAVKSASTAIFGNMPNMSEKQISEVVLPKLTNEIRVNAKFIEKVLTDQKVLEALREYGEALGLSVDVMIEIFKPVLSKVIDNTIEAFDESAEKAAAGATITALNVIKAAIAEIPVVGGLLDLGIAGAQAFNHAVAAASPFITKGAESFSEAANAYKKGSPDLQENYEKLTSAKKNVRYAMSDAMSDANVPRGGGRRKVDKTTRRILRSLDRFSRSRFSRSRLTRKRF